MRQSLIMGHIARTIDQRRNNDGFPKAGELVELKPSQELTLQDGRIFNLLVENAGPELAKDIWHEIAIQKLRGPKHRGGERVRDSVRRLMTTLVELPAVDRHGLPAVRTTALLSDNIATIDEDDPRAVLRYKLTETLREIIHNSKYWARLKGYVIFAFGSKYALSLYEAVCLRINRHADREFFTVQQFRDLLHVPNGKYPNFPQLRQQVIAPALMEVNGLSDFVVEVTPEREGGGLRGKLKGFTVEWRRKDHGEWGTTLEELSRPRLGRRERLLGIVEQISLYGDSD